MIIKVGETAPDFEATTLAGKKVKLSDYRGKVVYLDFWATWCAPCVAEIPNIKKAYESYGKDGNFVVLGVSVDADPAMVSRFASTRNIQWPLIGGGPSDVNPVAKKYYVTGVPATYLIDKKGKVVAKDLKGSRLEMELKKLLDAPTRHAAK